MCVQHAVCACACMRSVCVCVHMRTVMHGLMASVEVPHSHHAACHNTHPMQRACVIVNGQVATCLLCAHPLNGACMRHIRMHFSCVLHVCASCHATSHN
jgi:hypothetical protein